MRLRRQCHKEPHERNQTLHQLGQRNPAIPWLSPIHGSVSTDRGSMTRKQDIAVRPDNYSQPDYDGEVIAPIWSDVEDLSTIERFGFTKADLE